MQFGNSFYQIALDDATGAITSLLKGMKDVPAEQRSQFGKTVNDAKIKVSALLDEKEILLKKAEMQKGFERDAVDITLDGAPVKFGNLHPLNIVRNQIADNMIEIPNTDDRIYYLTSGSFNYLFSHEDTIYSTTTYNTRYGLHGDIQRSAVTFTEMPELDVRNGHVYALEGGSLASALLPESRTFQSLAVIEAQVPWEFKETAHGTRNFYQSGILSSLSDSTENVEVFIAMEAEGSGDGDLPRYIVLAPNNQAVQSAYDDGFISARGSKNFKGYMPNLFISVERSRLLDYPMPGDGQGTRTLYSFNPKGEGGEFTSVQISDMGSYLQITDTKGRTARVVNSFPYIYNDCAVYIIDNYLDFGDGTYVVE